jgi:hypothetical protein
MQHNERRKEGNNKEGNQLRVLGVGVKIILNRFERTSGQDLVG